MGDRCLVMGDRRLVVGDLAFAGWAMTVVARSKGLFSTAGEVGLEVIGANEIFDMQERRALEADVDECRLQPGEHPSHFA